MLDSQTLMLGRVMDVYSFRQQVTAANIANADTPGYRTRGIDFQRELSRALDAPAGEAFEPPRAEETGGLKVKNDGNDVHLDRELRNLSETAVLYNWLALWVRGNVQAVRNVIREGR